MKQCTKCKQLLPLEQFAICKSFKDGLQYQCKQCKKNPEHDKQARLSKPEYFRKKAKQRRINNKLPYHIVYLLPDCNYVGVTNNPIFRMDRHYSDKNRNTDNWIELARYELRKEALAHESKLHDQGYEGRKKTNNKTKIYV